MRHILLVANQTATSEPLLDAVRDRMAAGPCQFTLLVPSLPSDLANKMSNFGLMEAGVVPPAPAADSTYHSTRQRLDHGLQRLHELGATARGEVGREDPVAAITEIASRHQFDEIIISTLPRRVSRWLRQDVPSRVERKTRLPVTVVSGT